MSSQPASTAPAVAEHPWAAILPRVAKPARYLGGEEQQIVKPPAGLLCRFVLAFPDVYEIGMSHLGTRIIYELVNDVAELSCERAFTPWVDLEAELRAAGLPLVSLESWTPLSEFDVVGVSLQHELSYTNVLCNLELGGIPLRSAERGDGDPIVIGGGPTATHPEPIAPFLDALLVGEAEEVLPELLRTVGRLRRAGRPRAEVLAALAQLPGVFVPSFYVRELEPRNGMMVVTGRSAAGIAAGAPERVTRAWVRKLDDYPFPTRFPIARAEAIFDRAAVEITRGCTEGCRFCQAGIIYRPVRERSPAAIAKAVLAGVDNAGYSETSLTALSTADVSCIDPLIKALAPELARRKVKLGVASLRAYGVSGDLLDEFKRLGLSGLTFAPEAGTQRMRDVINKNVSDEDILGSAARIFSRGYDRMKMYFIIGLPTETDADVVGIVETGAKVRGVARELGLRRMPAVTVSVSQHVPKPHTPFQWAAMDGIEELHGKVAMLRTMCKRERLNLKTHDVRESWLECLFSRGDVRMADVLEHAYRAGARFDGWQDTFDLQRWLDALAACDIEPDTYTRTLPTDGKLPWDHLDIGLEPGFLAGEWRKAIKGRASPPCGKPFGDQVHHRELAAAESDERRLVCYDCGIACDMTQMRSERVVALRSLVREVVRPPEEIVTRQRSADDPDPDDVGPAAVDGGAPEVSLDRLRGRLPKSQLAADSVYRAAAEAPYSRVRVFFAKSGPLRFIGHLDLLRNLPRMFRRAGLEVAYSRGFNPVPRLSMAPALALGIAAEDDAFDVELLLPESLRDMDDELDDVARVGMATMVLEQLRKVAPLGFTVLDARVLPASTTKVGAAVAGADFTVSLPRESLDDSVARMADAMAQPSLPIWRRKHDKKTRDREIDVRPHIVTAEIDREASTLSFRLRMDPTGSARPREVVQALIGLQLGEHSMSRARLLARDGERWVPLREQA